MGDTGGVRRSLSLSLSVAPYPYPSQNKRELKDMKEELAYHMFNMEELPMVEQDLKEAVEKKCQGDQPLAVHVKEVRPGLTLDL